MGEGSEILKPTESDFDMKFLNSEFCIFPMNLVALAQDFQTRFALLLKETILDFELIFFVTLHSRMYS